MKLAVTIFAFCVAALLALGMVMLYSSSMAQVGTRYLIMQAVWCGLGLAACAGASLVDYRHLKKIWWLLLGLALVMLVLVLVRDSTTVYGELDNSRGTTRFLFFCNKSVRCKASSHAGQFRHRRYCDLIVFQ